jgi:hypothetical protein
MTIRRWYALTFAKRPIDEHAQAAERLNDARFDVVSLQHEYGIFGGQAGRHRDGAMKIVSKGGDPAATRKVIADERNALHLTHHMVSMGPAIGGAIAPVKTGGPCTSCNRPASVSAS